MISNRKTTLALVERLITLADAPNNPLALADWLEMHNDPRAASVRELALARCTWPPAEDEDDPQRFLGFGGWWGVILEDDGDFQRVAWYVYEDAPHAEAMPAWEPTDGFVMLDPGCVSAKLIRRIFIQCRCEMIRSLFDLD